tara:strand:+ start:990 stop:1916 length:927 start_codon:yes stop_codon:yes gene_type:complete
MLRHLILSTACGLVLTPVALAQQPVAPGTPSQLEQIGLTPPTILSQGYATGGQDTLVTQWLGETVFSSIADDADEIGTVTDLVVTSGVGVSAVVVSVGGFLGVGQKDVAIDFTQLEWATREDGARRWVLNTTAQALLDAPAFIWADSEAVTGEPALSPAEEEAQLVDGNPNVTDIDPALTTDQPGRQGTSTPIDRTGLSAVDTAGLTTEQMVGIGVYGIDDQQIGSIGEVLTHADGSIDAIIVDVGGFLGLGAKPVAVAYENLTFSSDTNDNRYLFINATREQLESQPAYDASTYPQDSANQRMVFTP